MKAAKQSTRKPKRSPREKLPKKEITVAASVAAASAIIGLPLTSLREAKRKGCPAFKHGGQVDMITLQSWLADNPDIAVAIEIAQKKEEAEARKVILQNAHLAHALQVRRREYVSTKEVVSIVSKFAHTLRAKLLELEKSLPKRLEDKAAPEIQVILKKHIRTLLSETSTGNWASSK